MTNQSENRPDTAISDVLGVGSLLAAYLVHRFWSTALEIRIALDLVVAYMWARGYPEASIEKVADITVADVRAGAVPPGPELPDAVMMAIGFVSYSGTYIILLLVLAAVSFVYGNGVLAEGNAEVSSDA